MEHLNWLFFDIGGTLFSETAAWGDRIRRTCEKNSIPEDVFRREMCIAASKNIHEYKGALAAFDIHFGEKWNSELITPYPSAREVLTALKKKYRLGIIANQPLNTRKRMQEEWQLAEFFDVMLISAEVGFSKPDPLLFREALYKTGAKAHECAMIGDKLTNDIAPAKALGFKTVWIRQEWGGMQTVTSEELRPDITVDSLTELLCCFGEVLK